MCVKVRSDSDGAAVCASGTIKSKHSPMGSPRRSEAGLTDQGAILRCAQRANKSVGPARDQPSVRRSGESGDLPTHGAGWLSAGHRSSDTLDQTNSMEVRLPPSPCMGWSRHSSRFRSCFREGLSGTCTSSILAPPSRHTGRRRSSSRRRPSLSLRCSGEPPPDPSGSPSVFRPPKTSTARCRLPSLRIEGGYSLRRALFAARSPAAAERARAWGARGDVVLLPHAVPLWNVSRTPSAVFTIGYAGRLVPEKGISDLVDAFLRMTVPAELVLFGDGPMRPGIERGSSKIKVVANLTHERMAEAYATIDLLVLPSHSTPTWKNSSARVLVEALSCGVPVLGSDSGEIPWVIRTTGGGEVFPEGDVAALASLLDDLAVDADRRARLAEQGEEAVRRLFSLEVVARSMRDVVDAAARP